MTTRWPPRSRPRTPTHGSQPRRLVLGSTTDARYYLNQFGRPAVAYGPTARNIHAADEAVELASIVAGARTLARFIARFFARGGLSRAGLPGSELPESELPVSELSEREAEQ